MRLPENHVGVQIMSTWDGGAILNANGRPVLGLTGQPLVEHTTGMHADEELLNKPGAVCIGRVVMDCEVFTNFPEVITIGDDVFGSELFHVGEVLPGDMVAIKQSEVDLETIVSTDREGIPMFAIPYSALLCICRGPLLVPVGGYTLAEHVYPPRAVRELAEGKVQYVLKNAVGIIEEYDVQPLMGQGRLAFLSKALIGQPLPFYPGQRVLYNRWTSGPVYRISSKNYFAVRHPDIVAVIGDNEEVLSLGEARYSREIKRPTRKE